MIKAAVSSAATPSGALPAGWAEQALSTAVVHPTGTTYDNPSGIWTWRGAGDDLWGNDDRVVFIHSTMGENEQVDAHIQTMVLEGGAIGDLEQYAGIYLMIRESLANNAVQAAVGVNPNNNRVQRKYRTSTNQSTSEDNINPGGPYVPIYFRITRPGDGTALCFYSYDGITYTQVGTALTVGSSDWYVGIALNSHDDATPDFIIATGTMSIT